MNSLHDFQCMVHAYLDDDYFASIFNGYAEKYGTVEYDGRTLAYTAYPYVEYTLGQPRYQGRAMDTDGRMYAVQADHICITSVTPVE